MIEGYEKVHGHALRPGDELISGYVVADARPSGETNAPTVTLTVTRDDGRGSSPATLVIGDHERAWRRQR